MGAERAGVELAPVRHGTGRAHRAAPMGAAGVFLVSQVRGNSLTGFLDEVRPTLPALHGTVLFTGALIRTERSACAAWHIKRGCCQRVFGDPARGSVIRPSRRVVCAAHHLTSDIRLMRCSRHLGVKVQGAPERGDLRVLRDGRSVLVVRHSEGRPPDHAGLLAGLEGPCQVAPSVC